MFYLLETKLSLNLLYLIAEPFEQEFYSVIDSVTETAIQSLSPSHCSVFILTFLPSQDKLSFSSSKVIY